MIKAQEQAQCQFKLIEWGIMFICGMIRLCAGKIKPSLSLDQLQQILQPILYIAIYC